MKTAEELARRRRLNSIDPNHLSQFVRRVLLGDSDDERRISFDAVAMVVESAAERGSDEAKWLNEHLMDRETFLFDKDLYFFPEDFYDGNHRLNRVFMMLNGGTDHRWGLYYRGKARQALCDSDGWEEGLFQTWDRPWYATDEVEDLRKSACSGCCPAMYALEDLGEGLEDEMSGPSWLGYMVFMHRKDRDPDGLAEWARREMFVDDDENLQYDEDEEDPVREEAVKKRIEEEKLLWYKEAAERGSVLALRELASVSTDKVQRAMLLARDALLSGDMGSVSDEVRSCAERLWAGHHALTAEDVKVLYVAGRELEGFEHVWGPESYVTPEENACIDVYATVVHRARRAALVTAVGFRKLGLARDVAVRIAQSVYRTREEDAFAWYHEPRLDNVLLSETAKAAVRSRRPKLDEFPAEHLISVVRATMFPGDLSRHSASVVETLLRSAAKTGDAEAVWLLKLVSNSRNPMPDVDEEDSGGWRNRSDIGNWLKDQFRGNDSVLGQFYSGLALLHHEHSREGEARLRKLAEEEEGFGPAMSAVAEEEKSQAWAQRAVDAGDPEGFALLADFVEDDAEQMWWYQEAAELGSLKGLYNWARMTTDKLQRAVLCARFVLLSGNVDMDCCEVRACVQALRDGRDMNAEEVRLMYFAGRELDGFEQFWTNGRRLKHEHRACISVYLTVTHRARQAALQVIVGLRELRLFRDLALLIARFVYQTREEDPFAWYDRCGPRPTWTVAAKKHKK